MSKKTFAILIIIATPILDALFLNFNVNTSTMQIISDTIVSLIIILSSIGFTTFFFYDNYKTEKKVFRDMIKACEDERVQQLLDIELTNYEAKRTKREIQEEPLSNVYLFFKAKSFIHKNSLQVSLEIFEKITHHIGKKYHLLYEVYFQMGLIYWQLQNYENANTYFAKALAGFKKYKYIEPIAIIEDLLKEEDIKIT